MLKIIFFRGKMGTINYRALSGLITFISPLYIFRTAEFWGWERITFIIRKQLRIKKMLNSTYLTRGWQTLALGPDLAQRFFLCGSQAKGGWSLHFEAIGKKTEVDCFVTCENYMKFKFHKGLVESFSVQKVLLQCSHPFAHISDYFVWQWQSSGSRDLVACKAENIYCWPFTETLAEAAALILNYYFWRGVSWRIFTYSLTHSCVTCLKTK